MNLREYLNGSDIWQEIENIKSFDFIQDVSLLDHIQVVEYGQREMFSTFESLTVTESATFIVNHFGDKWQALTDAKISDLNLASDSTKITNIETNVEEIKTGSENVDNKVSGYNSTDLITDSGNGTTRNEDNNQDTTTVKTESNGSYKALFNNLSTVEQSNIINVALKDVATYLTINLY